MSDNNGEGEVKNLKKWVTLSTYQAPNNKNQHFDNKDFDFK